MYPIIRHRVQSHKSPKGTSFRQGHPRRVRRPPSPYLVMPLVLAGPIRPALLAAPRVLGRLRTPAKRPHHLLPARPIPRSLAPPSLGCALCSPPLVSIAIDDCDRQIERTVEHPNSTNPQLPPLLQHVHLRRLGDVLSWRSAHGFCAGGLFAVLSERATLAVY
jgi:hypothetical protein